MRNIYFFETREEAKAFLKQMKKKGKTVSLSKESRPFETDNGKLLYYSIIWIFD